MRNSYRQSVQIRQQLRSNNVVKYHINLYHQKAQNSEFNQQYGCFGNNSWHET